MNVETLDCEKGEAAAALLAGAFHDYPFLARVFDGAKGPLPEMLLQLFRLSVETRLSTKCAGFAATDGEDLLGVATVVVPGSGQMSGELAAKWEMLESSMSPGGRELFRAYEEVQDETRPKEPHIYVAAIGVQPGHQGKGIGRALLAKVRDLASTLGVSGVALDTHAPENVAKYLNMGFELVAERNLLGMPNWYFWDHSERES